jgi:HlyD family secretion protein
LKRAIVPIVVIGVVVALGLFITRRLQAANPTEKTQFKVEQVQLGEVKKSVSATGTLQPWRFIDIKSKAGGRVDKLNVEVGDTVKVGQVMAEIDPSDTLLQVGQAQADIDSARARQAQSQVQLQLTIQQSRIAEQNAAAALEAARASLSAAKKRLQTAKQQSEAQPNLTKASINAAQASLDQAKQAKAALETSNQQERAQAKASKDQAEANRNNAKRNLDRQRNLLDRGFVSQQVVDSAEASYKVSEAQLAAAEKKLDTIEEEFKADIASADARIAQASAQLANAKVQSVEIKNRENAAEEAAAAVKQSEAQVKQAAATLKRTQEERRNNEIRRYDIATAQASIARAAATLKNANTTLEQTKVTAPVDGVVLKKYVEAGTMISSALSFAATGNNIVQLGDVTRMYIDVTVDETDIANVEDGQEVEVNIEAYPDIPFAGKVARIDPQAEVIQNVTMIHVRVEIDNTAPAYRLLKPGMNATCEFIVNKKENVVVVPTEAVRTDDKGQFVEIAKGGTPYKPSDPKEEVEPGTLQDVTVERRAVEIGLEGNESTEIASGLKEGETIVTQTIEPAPKTSGSPFGGGGMFGGGRGGGGRGGGGGGGRGR